MRRQECVVAMANWKVHLAHCCPTDHRQRSLQRNVMSTPATVTTIRLSNFLKRSKYLGWRWVLYVEDVVIQPCDGPRSRRSFFYRKSDQLALRMANIVNAQLDHDIMATDSSSHNSLVQVYDQAAQMMYRGLIPLSNPSARLIYRPE